MTDFRAEGGPEKSVLAKHLYYDREGITLYCGDCRDILSQIGPVSIVLTSSPYNVGIKYDCYDDRQDEADFWHWCEDWLGLTFAATTDPGRAYFFVGEKMLWWFKPTAERIGYRFHQKLTWCKPNISATGGRISCDWTLLSEDILLFHKGKRTRMLNNFEESRTFNWMVEPACQSQWLVDTRVHPAQFPLKVARRLLARTPGDTVLDPFCGSGTTLVAAKQLGRKAIGIEISEAYCQLAVKRLAQMVMPLEVS